MPHLTINYYTNTAAAIAKQLLADDSAWINAMEEASDYQMPVELRHLFAVIWLNCQPSKAAYLFCTFLPYLMEDYIHQGYDSDVTKNLNLKYIMELFRLMGDLNEDFGLPVPDYEHTLPIFFFY